MSDIFEVQDEIAHKIAEALRIKLHAPGAGAALAAKPTRQPPGVRPPTCAAAATRAGAATRGTMEFALQMFEHAVALRSQLRARWAAIRQRLLPHAQYWSGPGGTLYGAGPVGLVTARWALCAPDHPRSFWISQGWILYAGGRYEDAVRLTRGRRSPASRDCEEGAYSPPLLRSLFADGKYEEVAALEGRGRSRLLATDYNVYIPIMNALGATGKTDATRDVRLRLIQTMENHCARCRRTRGRGSSSGACTLRSSAPTTRSAKRISR